MKNYGVHLPNNGVFFAKITLKSPFLEYQGGSTIVPPADSSYTSLWMPAAVYSRIIVSHDHIVVNLLSAMNQVGSSEDIDKNQGVHCQDDDTETKVASNTTRSPAGAGTSEGPKRQPYGMLRLE